MADTPPTIRCVITVSWCAAHHSPSGHAESDADSPAHADAQRGLTRSRRDREGQTILTQSRQAREGQKVLTRSRGDRKGRKIVTRSRRVRKGHAVLTRSRQAREGQLALRLRGLAWDRSATWCGIRRAARGRADRTYAEPPRSQRSNDSHAEPPSSRRSASF